MKQLGTTNLKLIRSPAKLFPHNFMSAAPKQVSAVFHHSLRWTVELEEKEVTHIHTTYGIAGNNYLTSS